jgi:hypothetical protein
MTSTPAELPYITQAIQCVEATYAKHEDTCCGIQLALHRFHGTKPSWEFYQPEPPPLTAEACLAYEEDLKNLHKEVLRFWLEALRAKEPVDLGEIVNILSNMVNTHVEIITVLHLEFGIPEKDTVST